VPKTRAYTSAIEMEQLRSLWEQLTRNNRWTIFQDFRWNVFAAQVFGQSEAPFVVSTETSYGAAIVPAVLRSGDQPMRLLGEELFDYRCFLHEGDEEVLRMALTGLSAMRRPLEVVAFRELDRMALPQELRPTPFCGAPAVNCEDVAADAFAARHNRLGRNLRRLQRLGYEIHSYHGADSQLVRYIYQRKQAQASHSLFHDPARIEFMVGAAMIEPSRFEIFTLESGSHLAAALVILRDQDVRRFYTVWFDSILAKHSPAVTLIYEITRQSLAYGLSCDYMTGDQGYKLRLATSSMPLYRLRATAEELGELALTDKPKELVA
jgi:CelD/BcsL family acetyltransferase involved in cellulose biosynthesis